MKFECHKVEELRQIGSEIISHFADRRVFALYGNMGSGKTTLTKEFCSILNSVDVVTSPTFAIINEYLTENNEYLYHFDCYRLKNKNEFSDIGGVDYFYSGYYCFVEWPQIIEEFLPEDTIKIFIEVDENTMTRTITVQ